MSAPALLTDGSVNQHVLRLSGFMILGFLSMTLAQLLEVVYLGWVGGAQLAAIAFTFPVVLAFNAVTRGIGIGTSALLARAVGARDQERAALLASHGLLLTFIFTVLCALLLSVLASPLFALLGARGQVRELATLYLSLWCFGFPAFGVSMVGSGLMRSFGAAAMPGLVMAVGAALQVVFGGLLIFGVGPLPALGIAGAALAFGLARSVSLVVTVLWFARRSLIRWRLAGLLESARAIAHVGVPAGATNLIQPLSVAISTWVLATYSAQVVAGFGVAMRIDQVATMMVIGIAASIPPLVGQNWGARRYDRVDQAVALVLKYCHIWGLCAGLIFWIAGEWLVSSIASDPEIVRVASLWLWIVPVTIGFFGTLNVANNGFNALSRPLPPLVLSLARVVALHMPLALLASWWLGYVGVFLVVAGLNVLFGCAGWFWFRRVSLSLRARRVRN